MLQPQGCHLLRGHGQLSNALPLELALLVGFLQGTDPFLVILLGPGRWLLSGTRPAPCGVQADGASTRPLSAELRPP